MAANINKVLDTRNSRAHNNGFVGYDSDTIYNDNTIFGEAGIYSKNGDRVKGLFDKLITERDPSSIATRFHLHKSELEISGDNIIGRVSDLIELKTNAVQRLRDINGTDALQIQENIQAEIDSYDNELTLLNQSSNFLVDNTIEMIGDSSIEEGANDAYNPDFPVNSVSYMYRRQDFGVNERGALQDGIKSGYKAPNVAYPVNKDSIVVSPMQGSGGFGSSNTSLNQGELSSLNVINRYTEDS